MDYTIQNKFYKKVYRAGIYVHAEIYGVTDNYVCHQNFAINGLFWDATENVFKKAHKWADNQLRVLRQYTILPRDLYPAMPQASLGHIVLPTEESWK
jgi:hypothetical protein